MYFEDFSVGDAFTSDPVTLTESEIIAFAREHDPQPMHTDPAAAADTVYGGLIASGWQVLSRTFGLAVKMGIFDRGGIGSPGLDEVRWRHPVRPGDSLHLSITVSSIRPSATRDDRGYVTLSIEIVNQDDVVVTSYRSVEIFLRRPG